MQNYSELDEEELLALLSKSDRPAFKQLYVKHYDRIYAYALKFTKSADLAEDITQDVFVKIWENRNNMSDIKFLAAYLFKTCKNITLNVLSRAAKEENIKASISTGAGQSYMENDVACPRDDYEKWLVLAIEQLPCQRKQVFRFCKIEGKTYSEVATILGISTGTINDHIVKATKSIRRYLKEQRIKIN